LTLRWRPVSPTSRTLPRQSARSRDDGLDLRRGGPAEIIERLAFGDKRAERRTAARRRRWRGLRVELPVAAAIRPEKSQSNAFQC